MSEHSALCFATTNAGKLREAEHWLGVPVRGVELELEEPQTTDLEALAGAHRPPARDRERDRELLVGTDVGQQWGVGRDDAVSGTLAR